MRDAGYRTQEEIAEWKTRCPIKAFEAKLLGDGVATQAELDQVDAEVKAIVEDAAAFALNSPMPEPATVTEHVYSAG